MNRREAIIAGMAGLTAAAAVAPTADAQTSKANPELEQVRALLRAHDEAFTNHDLNGIMACLTEKAAIMGTGPGEIWSGPDETKWPMNTFSKASTRENKNSNTSSGLGD